MDHTAFYTANTPCRLYRVVRQGAPRLNEQLYSTSWWSYYSFIDPLRMKGWVGLVMADLRRTVYPYKWLPISCRSGADRSETDVLPLSHLATNLQREPEKPTNQRCRESTCPWWTLFYKLKLTDWNRALWFVTQVTMATDTTQLL